MSLRPARIYRKIPSTAFTRYAKRNDKRNYIGGVPASRITIFFVGEKNKEFPVYLLLKIQNDMAVRSEALEAMRIASNSFLRKKLEADGYNLRVLVYPHHILRYHPVAGIAQADRYYEGMRRPFGRPIGRAALVRSGQEILRIGVDQAHIDIARAAMKRASAKIGTSVKIVVEKKV